MLSCTKIIKASLSLFWTRKMSSLTKCTLENRIAEITMCHTQTRNSLSVEMMNDLIANINNYEQDPAVRVIVLAAEGPVFSAGHNLKELNAGRQQQEKVFETASKLMNTIIDSPVPILAKIDGIAAAAGCQLVAQCDLAFCSEKSAFSTPGATFGIFCSTPGVALARCVPKTTAMKMLLTGQSITSREAEASGLITKVCEDLDEEIRKNSEMIIAKSRSVITLGKQFFYQQINCEVKEAYKRGERVMVENLQIDDGKEGLNSFIEKRKPVWKTQ